MTNKEFTNQLILGDNLEILKTMESDSIDLIYLDPPFFSNRNYEVIWGDDGEVDESGLDGMDKIKLNVKEVCQSIT